MAWEIPVRLQGQAETAWCLLLSREEGGGGKGEKKSADGEPGCASYLFA